MLEFMFAFSQVALTLARLLKVRFLDGNYASAGPIGHALQDVLRLHNAGKITQRDGELNRLSMLARQLKTIEAHDPELLRPFRRVLVQGDNSEYLGCRFEVSICATFIANRIPFVKGDAPDFSVQSSLGGAYVECATVRLVTPTEKDLTYKILGAINEKASKSYAASGLAVFIDVTNILFHMDRQDRDNNLDTIIADVKRSLQSTTIGSVVLFSFLFEEGEESGDPSLRAWRIDGPNPTPELVALLDALFPGALGPPKVVAIPSLV